jgi:hypothetical protein
VRGTVMALGVGMIGGSPEAGGAYEHGPVVVVQSGRGRGGGGGGEGEEH